MATRAPDETDILCESCGYMLNGLPESGKCPECGSPIDLSVSPLLRVPPPWENPDDPRPRWRRFLATTAEVIFHPQRFYRSLNSRGEVAPALQFASIHWMIASVLFGLTAWRHWWWYLSMFGQAALPRIHPLPFLLLFCIGLYPLIRITIMLAAWLTTLEGTYRGYRLPLRVVRRALYYHAAQLLPVAAVALATVVGYTTLQTHDIFSVNSEIKYLYVLSGEVIVLAGYLFNAYWIAMRNLMYANR